MLSSNNYGGTACSYIEWTAPSATTSATTVFVREGCQAGSATDRYGCGGTVMYSLSGYVAPSPPPPPAVIPVSMCAPYTSADISIISNAPNTLYNVCMLQLTQGTLVTITTGPSLPGAQCAGSTYLYLVTPASPGGGVAYQVNGGGWSYSKTVAASNNQWTEGGSCASITYLPESTGTYTLLEGCDRNTQCSGTVAVQGGSVSSSGIYPAPPSPPPPPAPAPPVQNAPATGTRAPTQVAWTAWSKSNVASASANGTLQTWLSTYNAAASQDAAVFPTITGAIPYPSDAVGTATLMTNGVSQASSVSFGATASMPFLTNDLCPMTAQGFSLQLLSVGAERPEQLGQRAGAQLRGCVCEQAQLSARFRPKRLAGARRQVHHAPGGHLRQRVRHHARHALHRHVDAVRQQQGDGRRHRLPRGVHVTVHRQYRHLADAGGAAAVRRPLQPRHE